MLQQLPQSFLLTPLGQFGPLVMLAVGAVAVVMVVLGLRGFLLLDDPRCASCRYDLTRPGARVARCPECGADLACPGSVRFARRVRRPRLVIAGLALLLIQGLAGLGTALWSRHAAATQAAALPAGGVTRTGDALLGLRTEELIGLLPERISDHLFWRELEARLETGRLSSQHAEDLIAATEALATTLEANSGPGLPDFQWGRSFFDAFSRAGLASDDRVCAFAAALGGRPRISAPAKVGVGQSVDLDLDRRRSMGIVRSVVRVVGARVDGTPLSDGTDDDSRQRAADHLPTLDPFDAEGRHTVEVDVEWLVLPRTNGRQPSDDDLWEAADAAADLRKAGIYARRQATLKHVVEVVGKDVPLVAPVVDPDQRAAVRGAFAVTKAVISRAPVGTTLTLELQLDCSPPRNNLPLILRPVIEIGGHRLTDRAFIAVSTPTGRSRTGPTSWRFEVPPLGDDVRTLRLVLEPVLDDPRLATGHERAWGEPIEFEEVVVERRDLRP